jgi:protein ImuB
MPRRRRVGFDFLPADRAGADVAARRKSNLTPVLALTRMLWAALHLPQRSLDAALRRQDDPQRPLALIAGPPQRRRLVLVNPAAAAGGLQPGQALAAAQALCPGLVVLPWDAAEATRLLGLVAAWAYRYSGQVCSDGIDTVWLEVGASMALFGPWPRFERLLRDDLRELQLAHTLAVAPTPLAAQALAQRADGLAVTDLAQMRRALQGLPLAVAPFADDIRDALAGMGVQRLRQLFALPRAGLQRRFGAGFLATLDRLTGAAPDLRTYWQPPDRFEARFEFDDEIRYSTGLLFPLKRLLADLAAYLAGRDGGVQRFTLVFEHDLRPATTHDVGLLQPERDPGRLFDLAKLTLERQQVAAPVRALGLRAEQLPAFVPAGRDLFEARPASALDWPALQARLQARLGAAAVYQLVPMPDPRPEHAQRQVREGLQARSANCETSLPRPAWLLPRPIPWREANPRLLAGPERIESGWWDGGDVRRDYYVALTATGQRAWVFCPAGSHGPFLLHGWFA